MRNKAMAGAEVDVASIACARPRFAPLWGFNAVLPPHVAPLLRGGSKAFLTLRALDALDEAGHPYFVLYWVLHFQPGHDFLPLPWKIHDKGLPIRECGH